MASKRSKHIEDEQDPKDDIFSQYVDEGAGEIPMEETTTSKFTCGCQLLSPNPKIECASCRVVEYCNKLHVKNTDAIRKYLDVLQELDVDRRGYGIESEEHLKFQQQRIWGSIHMITCSTISELTKDLKPNY